MTVKIIVLDAGHGGRDVGASGFGLREKDVALKLVLATKKILDANYKDIQIVLTRSGDTYPTLSERTRKANSVNADLFVSFHCNASTTAQPLGFESYIYNGVTSSRTKNAQNKIHLSIQKNAPFFQDRGKRTANFQVLRESKMPSCLLEFGFISNQHDNTVLRDNNKLEKLSLATALGIADALELVKKSISTSNYMVVKSFDDKEMAQDYLSSLEREGHKGFTIQKD